MKNVSVYMLSRAVAVIKDVTITECDDTGVFRCFDVLGNVLFWARADNINYILFEYEEVKNDETQ